MQFPGIDFNLDQLYAPVASHDAIRMVLAISPIYGLLDEGGDLCNAYLYGDIDMEIFIEQPTNSSCIPENSGHCYS